MRNKNRASGPEYKEDKLLTKREKRIVGASSLERRQEEMLQKSMINKMSMYRLYLHRDTMPSAEKAERLISYCLSITGSSGCLEPGAGGTQG